MSAYSDRVVADGAVAYWRLNEASGLVAHDSVGGNNGAIAGGVTLNQGGALPGDAAMAFDGVSGKIDIPNGPAIHGFGLGPFTIELWVRLLPSSNYRVAMRSLGTVAGAQSWVQVYQGGDTNLVCSLGDPTNAIAMLAFAIVPQDNQWRHIVYTITRGSPDVCAAYLNGVLVQTNNATTSGVDYTFVNELSLGYDYTANGYWCPGALDDIAIYHTALTPAQIATHYALRLGYDPYATKVISDGAVAYWRLDETSGLIARDTIGGNTGTISGGVTLNQPGAIPGHAAMAFNPAGPAHGGITVPLGAYSACGTGPATVECWLKSTTGVIPGVHEYLLLTTDPASGLGGILIYHSAGSTSLTTVWSEPAGPQLGPPAITKPSDGVWHYLVSVVRRGAPNDTFETWLDGVLQPSTTTPTGKNFSGTNPFRMAVGVNSTDQEWQGGIDEIAIYPTALSPAQILAHYSTAQSLAAAGATRFRARYRWAARSA